jgi:hypothetical protein
VVVTRMRAASSRARSRLEPSTRAIGYLSRQLVGRSGSAVTGAPRAQIWWKERWPATVSRLALPRIRRSNKRIKLTHVSCSQEKRRSFAAYPQQR